MSEERFVKHVQNTLISKGYPLKYGADGHASPGGETETQFDLMANGIQPEIKSPTVPDDETGIVPAVDSRSEANLKTLHPRFQPIAMAFITEARRTLGDFRITSGFRSYAEQDALYAQGRTKPGRIVTNARAGSSVHNFALACDITLFSPDGQPIWDSPLYEKAGLLAETMGLDWAGGGVMEDFGDEPHMEWPGATKSIATYRNRVAQGLDPLS